VSRKKSRPARSPVDRYRAAWFALLKELGVPDEDRHWLQEDITGKASTRDWTLADWDKAVGEAQRMLGQHNDRHAHVRTRGGDAPAGDREWATLEQCHLIEQIADEIEWRVGRERGPIAYLRRSSLKGPSAALRREVLGRHFAEGLRGIALWTHLTRAEASGFVRALKELKRRAPSNTRRSVCQR